MILAIDPGTTLSAFVILDPSGAITRHGKIPNADMRTITREHPGPVAIEMIACYGMGVGREVFETCVWIGRYVEAARSLPACIYRADVKLHLCKSMRADDSNIRTALVDRYGPGKAKAIGLKHSPGPCYGIAGDVWAALGVGVTYLDDPFAFAPYCGPMGHDIEALT
jgi:hypothetical protein